MPLVYQLKDKDEMTALKKIKTTTTKTKGKIQLSVIFKKHTKMEKTSEN